MAKSGIKEDSTSVMLCEEKVFDWEIKDFRANIVNLYGFKDILSCMFEVGDHIDLPSKWKVSLYKYSGSDKGIQIKLESPDSQEFLEGYAGFGVEISHPEIKPQCSSSLKSKNRSGYIFITESLENFSDANLINGSLVIKIRFTLYKEIIKNSAAVKYSVKSRTSVLGDIEALLDSGENADIKIETKDGQTLQAHKLILTARSTVFNTMFRTEMHECSSGVVRIDDVTYQAMKLVLQFIYSGYVDESWVEVAEELVYAAEKYQLKLLTEFCDKNLVTTCKPDNAYTRLKLTQVYGLKIAEAKIKDFIKTHMDEIIEAKMSKWAKRT